MSLHAIKPASAVPQSEYERRARYYSPANIFMVKRPTVPQHVFTAECGRALAEGTPSEWIMLDVGAEMGFDFPATTPLLLGRYARIEPGETLTGRFAASGEIYYVIRGNGSAAKEADELFWAAGDVFALPGGGETQLTAGKDGAVLFMVTNEPEMRYLGLAVPQPEDAPCEAVLYPDAEIRGQMEKTRAEQMADPNVSGLTVHFVSEKMDRWKSLHPTIVLAMNSLGAGRAQRPHRHNSVALTLPIQSKGVHSLIEGNRIDWQQYAAMITPPSELHEHRNEGEEMMYSLVVQDSGLYYHLRNIGFSFG